MSTGWIVFFVVLVVTAVVMAVLYFLGKRAEKQQEEAQAQMAANSQTVSVLVIDKKKMKIKEAGFPQMVIDQMPKRAKLVKFPVVKCKVGAKITPFLCDEKVYDLIPVKRECKVVVSGLYITSIKSARGGLATPPEKKGFFKRIFSRNK